MSNHKPTVSIVCLTYNQADFIRKTLDSFLMQKTNFSFEVLIHDDASTDGTISIIEEYVEKYPDIVKPVYEKTNRYSQNDYSFINDTYQRASGDYVAFCEGDDYWTDPDKLQLQVDYMKNNPKTTICFHPVKVFFENNEVENETYPQVNANSIFTIKELLKKNYIQSNSVLYKKSHTDYTTLPSNIIPSDWYMHLYHAQHGEIGFINKVMSAYRRHPGGVWWDAYKHIDRIWIKYGRGHLELYKAMLSMYGDNKEFREIINGKIQDAFYYIIKFNDEDIANSILRDYSELAKKSLIAYRVALEASTKKLQQVEKGLLEQKQHTQRIQRQRDEIADSREFRTGRAVLALPRKIFRLPRRSRRLSIADPSGKAMESKKEQIRKHKTRQEKQ